MLKEAFDIGKDVWGLIQSIDADKRAKAIAYVRARWQGFAALAIAAGVGFGVYQYVASAPERLIHQFYKSLNVGEYEAAWQLLGRQYRDKKLDLERFKDGFKNTVAHPRVRTKVLGENDGVVAIYASVVVIKQDGATTAPEEVCRLFYLQKEPLKGVPTGWTSVLWARLLEEDWRVVLINVRGECHYFNIGTLSHSSNDGSQVTPSK